jgi:hypothetical protein
MTTEPGGLPDAAELRTLVARLRQETEAIRLEAEATRDAVRAEAAQSRAERDQALADLHRAARDGELGDVGRRLARRVDDGDARWVDVLHERDPSPEAAALRRDAASSIGRLVDELAQDDPALAHATGRDQSDDQE